jgi:hypothetical protein
MKRPHGDGSGALAALRWGAMPFSGAAPRRFLPLVLAALVGCGARTDLYAPPPPDAAVDAEAPRVIPCIEVPADGTPVRAELELLAEVGRADIVFLIDVTLSMRQEIDQIRRRLRDRIAPGINDAVPGARLGVATFGDFPVPNYGIPGIDYPFRLHLRATDELEQVQAAMDSIQLGNGGDEPESQVEALYQLATGEGIGDYVPPSLGCPGGGRGYACFRDDALPVVLLFTDAPFHEGPGGYAPYSAAALGLVPHVYADAVRALNALGAKVIGFDSGPGSLAGNHLRAVARDTGTVDDRGRPLVFDIGPTGANLDTDVVDAVRTFASTLIQDVDAIARDADPNDGVDVEEWVQALIPIAASPMSGIESIDLDENVFRGVHAGTLVTFEIVVQAGVVEPGPEPIVVLADIVFRGNGTNTLDVLRVELIVPALDGTGCEDPLVTTPVTPVP